MEKVNFAGSMYDLYSRFRGAIDDYQIERIERDQTSFLQIFDTLNEQSEAFHKAKGFLSPIQRESLRRLFTDLKHVDKKVNTYDAFLEKRLSGPANAKKLRLATLSVESKRITEHINDFKNNCMSLIGNIFDSEYAEAVEAESLLYHDGPTHCWQLLHSLEREVKRDRAMLDSFGSLYKKEFSDRTEKRTRKIEDVKHEYERFNGYLEHLKEYRSQLADLKSRLARMRDQKDYMDYQDNLLNVYMINSQAQKADFLQKCRNLFSTKLAYIDEAKELNDRLGRQNSEFEKLEAWFDNLFYKPMEVCELFAGIKHEHETLGTQIKYNEDELNAIAQVIQMVESSGGNTQPPVPAS